MAAELTRAQRWLRGQLVSSAQVLALIGEKVYELPAPQASAPPYVVFDYRGGADQTLKGLRQVSTLYFGVVAVGEGVPTLRLSDLADAIDDALTGQSGQIENIQVDTCERIQPLSGVGFQSGDDRRYLGGLYKLTARTIA
jgi:hypothetical protein